MPEALLVSLLIFAAFGAGLTAVSLLVDALVHGFAGRSDRGVMSVISIRETVFIVLTFVTFGILASIIAALVHV